MILNSVLLGSVVNSGPVFKILAFVNAEAITQEYFVRMVSDILFLSLIMFQFIRHMINYKILQTIFIIS